ncbi:hypothetical protein AVEN_157661-1, partial [Araneus ventricosus]
MCVPGLNQILTTGNISYHAHASTTSRNPIPGPTFFNFLCKPCTPCPPTHVPTPAAFMARQFRWSVGYWVRLDIRSSAPRHVSSDRFLTLTFRHGAVEFAWPAGTPHHSIFHPTHLGIAYIGGACQVDERNRRTEKVGIVEDNGGFSGILSAAHEIAHLLGAKHDGFPPSPFLGGPGAAGCSSQGGYIMSLKKFGSRRFQWSRCTIEQFRHFLSTPRASCLFNHPSGNRLGDSKWPGQLLSLDEQCKRDGGTGACQRDSRVCSQLHCYSATGHCYASRPAAEGSPCGHDRICRNGDCVASAFSTLAGNSFNSRT